MTDEWQMAFIEGIKTLLQEQAFVTFMIALV